MKDLDKLVNELVLSSKQDRLKIAFKLIGSVMLDEQAMDFKSTLNLGDGVSMTLLSKLYIENEH